MKLGINEISKLYYGTSEVGQLASSGVSVVFLTDEAQPPTPPPAFVGIRGTLVDGTSSFTFKLNNTDVTPTIYQEDNKTKFEWEYDDRQITSLQNAFSGKTALVSVDEWTVPVEATANTDNMFKGCNNLIQPFYFSGQKYVGENCFSGCTGMQGNLVIPDSVISLGTFAYNWCSGLTGTLTIGSGVTSIGQFAFIDIRNMTGDVVIPNSVTTIADYAFNSAKGFNGSLTIGNSVQSIGKRAFYNMVALTGEIAFPSSMSQISSGCCSGCTSISAVTIPSSITKINDKAFSQCTHLSKVTVNRATPPTLGSNVFQNTNNCQIYVPSESVSAYKSAAGWSSYSSRIVAIPST